MLHAHPKYEAPAAPIDGGTVEVYALKDMYTQRGDKEVLAHPKGSVQRLTYAVARELVKAQPEDYGYSPVEGAPPAPLGSPTNRALVPGGKGPEDQPFDFTTLDGVDDKMARKLNDAGIVSLADLHGAGEEELEAAGVGSKLVTKLREASQPATLTTEQQAELDAATNTPPTVPNTLAPVTASPVPQPSAPTTTTGTGTKKADAKK